MKIIGIAGPNGSGKDTVGDLLADEHGFLFISVTELLRDELRRRNLPIVRENTRMVSIEWRREFGPGVLVDKALETFKQMGGAQKYKGLVMSSLRNLGEVERLHEAGGVLVWVDADPRLRYERIQAVDRGRAGEDNKTFEQFQQEEHDEMHPADPSDPSLLNGAAVRELADTTLLNETTLEDLQAATAAALGL